MKNNIYIRAWRGELSLPIAFWVVQFLTTIVLIIIFAEILREPIGLPATALYAIYAAICVWRCSKKYKKESKSKFKGFNIVMALLWSCLCILFLIITNIAYI